MLEAENSVQAGEEAPMREYSCATCGTKGESHGVRPSGWGMETTENAPSTWRRWCPPCWRKHIGLDVSGPNPFLPSLPVPSTEEPRDG